MKNIFKLQLIILACLSLQATAQVKNTYSFAQGDTTQVTISWDAWAVSGDPILGCNIYRLENPNEPLNVELITSTDSTYKFIDNTTFNPYFPPKYLIRAVRSSDTLDVAYADAFTSIEFKTLESGTLIVELVVWNPDTCCIGVFVYHDDIVYGFITYNNPFIFSPAQLATPGHYDSFTLRFLSDMGFYANLKFTEDFITNLYTTVGISEMPEIANQIGIYPNPANDQITFTLEHKEHHRNIELRCYNLLGRLQYQAKVVTNHDGVQNPIGITTNVNNWPPGIYIAVVYSDGKPVGSEKFVVY